MSDRCPTCRHTKLGLGACSVFDFLRTGPCNCIDIWHWTSPTQEMQNVR